MRLRDLISTGERWEHHPAVPRLPPCRITRLLLTTALVLGFHGAIPAQAQESVISSPAAAGAPFDRTAWVSAPQRLRIPAIRVTSPVIPLGLQRDGSLQVPRDAHSSGWFAGGPRPGKVGPAVIAAHVHWDGRWAVFQHLEDLAYGDRILVDRRDGSTVTFRVTRVARYKKTHFPTQLVYGNIAHSGLRLITCDSFSVTRRAYLDNIVVFAVLVAPPTAHA